MPEDKVIGKAFVIIWPLRACGMAAVSVTDDLDRYERVLRAQGFSRIAGADEAGRGALAGPLVAAAVILPVDFDRTGIRDSKVLTPQPARGGLRAPGGRRRLRRRPRPSPA